MKSLTRNANKTSSFGRILGSITLKSCSANKTFKPRIISWFCLMNTYVKCSVRCIKSLKRLLTYFKWRKFSMTFREAIIIAGMDLKVWKLQRDLTNTFKNSLKYKEEKTYHPWILMFCCFFSPNNTTTHRVLEYVWSTAGSRPKTSKKISTRVIRIIPIWSSLSVCCCILALRSLTRKKIVCVDNLITSSIQIVQWICIEFFKWVSKYMNESYWCRDAGVGGGGGKVFDRSIYPSRTKGADYAHHITTDPPIFLTMRRNCDDSDIVSKLTHHR